MKRYKCNDCGSYVSLLVDVQYAKCPQCDGELVQCVETAYPAHAPVPSCKIQYLVFEDDARELIVSGHSQSHAFRYDKDKNGNTYDWQPMGLVDVFQTYSKFKDCVGRIF
jgi:hypothetical protein